MNLFSASVPVILLHTLLYIFFFAAAFYLQDLWLHFSILLGPFSVAMALFFIIPQDSIDLAFQMIIATYAQLPRR